jgi:4-hydroxy-tetrahydrodipicolinate synthase
VIAGTGTASTRHSIELGEIARRCGVDGLLVVSPYYSRPTQAGLEAHYRALTSAVPLPTVLYNIPLRTGVDVEIATLERLSDVKAIVAVKEATNNVVRSADILARLGGRYVVLSGDDGLTLPIMAVGGRGVISVASNVVPAEIAKLARLCASADPAAARAQAERLRPLFGALFLEASPGPVKAALALCERIAPEIRLPLVMPGEATVARLRAELARLGVS